MKILNVIMAVLLIGIFFGCGKNGSDVVKPSNITGSSLVADSVSIYTGTYFPDFDFTTVNGPLKTATYRYPFGMVQDKAGNLFVAELTNNDIRKITPNGTVSTYATGLYHPQHLALDSAGDLYVTEDTEIVKVYPNGLIKVVANYITPTCVMNDSKGQIYASEPNAVLKLNPKTDQFAYFAGIGNVGFVDAKGLAAEFKFIAAIAADINGNIIVLDNGNGIRAIDPTTTEVKTLPLKGAQTPFGNPTDLVLDQWDNIYVADEGADTYQTTNPNQGNGYVVKITPDGTASRFAGNGELIGDAYLHGPALSVAFNGPAAITLLHSGDLLVSSLFGVIQKIGTHQK